MTELMAGSGDQGIALVIFATTVASAVGFWLWTEARGNLQARGLVAALWLVLALMAGIAGAPWTLVMMASTVVVFASVAAVGWAAAHW